MLASFRLTFIIHRVEYSGSISDLPPALEKPDCYCDPCKKKGVMTKTAKVFCTKCEHKYCAKHEEVCRLTLLSYLLFFNCDIVDKKDKDNYLSLVIRSKW